MFQPFRPESNVHSARASNDAHVIWNMRAREELNKFKVYVHATGGKLKFFAYIKKYPGFWISYDYLYKSFIF